MKVKKSIKKAVKKVVAKKATAKGGVKKAMVARKTRSIQIVHAPEPAPMMPHHVPEIDATHQDQNGLPTESEPQ